MIIVQAESDQDDVFDDIRGEDLVFLFTYISPVFAL